MRALIFKFATRSKRDWARSASCSIASRSREHIQASSTLSMRAIYRSNDDQGLSFEDRPIPEGQLADAEYYREQTEAAAEGSDELLKYLENGDLSIEDIVAGSRSNAAKRDCSSALWLSI